MPAIRFLISLILWTNAIFKPLLAMPTEFYNADRRSDFTSGVCIDLGVHQVAHCLRECAFFEKEVGVGDCRLNDPSETARSVSAASIGAVHRFVNVSSKHVECDRTGRKVHVSFVIPEKRDREVYGLSGKEKNCPFCFEQSVLETVSIGCRDAGEDAKGFGNIEEIDPSGGIIPISGKHKISVRSAWTDFANVRAGNANAFVVVESGSAVSTNHKIIWSLHDKEDGRGANVRGKDKRKRKTDGPKYMRYQTTGGIDGGIFYEGFRHALSLDYLDVDVSTDGKTWLHAFGPICIRHLDKYSPQ